MKGFDLGLRKNDFKQPGSRSPDAKGKLKLPVKVCGEILRAHQNKTLKTVIDDYSGEEVVELGASAWQNRGDNPKVPAISVKFNSYSEQLDLDAKAQARRDQEALNNAQPGGFGDFNNGFGGQQQPPQQQQPPLNPVLTTPVGATAGNGAGNLGAEPNSHDIPF